MDSSLTLSPTPNNVFLAVFIIAQVITFAGVVANMVLNYKRDARNRQWVLEDRAADRKETQAVATSMVSHTSQTAAETQGHLITIADEVRATKAAAHEAYREANHVNLKLETLGLEKNRIDEVRIRDLILAGVREELARTSPKARR